LPEAQRGLGSNRPEQDFCQNSDTLEIGEEWEKENKGSAVQLAPGIGASDPLSGLVNVSPVEAWERIRPFNLSAGSIFFACSQ
jgi:hypothetical protein